MRKHGLSSVEINDSAVLVLSNAISLLRKLASFAIVLLFAICIYVMVYTIFFIQMHGAEGFAYNVSTHGQISIIIVIIIFWAVWSFAAGRKIAVLFLRKFGDETANNVALSAIKSSLRRRARLYVLDDSHFKSVGVPLREKLISLLYSVPFITAIFLTLIYVKPVKGVSIYARENGIVNWGERGYFNEAPLLSFPEGIGIWMIIGLLSVPPLRSLLAAFEGTMSVKVEQQITRVVRHIRWSSGWVAAPRLMAPMAMVVRCDDEIWRATVERLVAECDLILIDISRNTDALRWELALCADRASGRTLVMRRCQVAQEGEVEQPQSAEVLHTDKFNVLEYVEQGEDAWSELKAVIANHKAFLEWHVLRR